MKQALLLLLFLPCTLMASGKKAPPASISFHIESHAAEAPRFARKVKTLAGEKYFKVVPAVSTKDIIAFSPFPADDKLTYGLVFKLSPQASRRLQATTNMNQGKLLLTLVNGQAVGVVLIDKPVSDGMLVIWKGIKLEEIRLYDQVAPRIGENKKTWKERLKKEKKARR